MSEDRDLLDRIGKLAGRINLHRTQTPSGQDQQTTSTPSHAWNESAPGASNRPGSWRSSRVAPYGRGRGRAGKPAANPHRHRTLVMNNKVTAASQEVEDIHADVPQPPANPVNSKEGSETSQTIHGWVSKRDRHAQLINSTIYEKKTQVRNKAIDETRKQNALRRDHREKLKIERHLTSLGPINAGQSVNTITVHEIMINGLRFQVLDRGSKLARIRGAHLEHLYASSHSRYIGSTDSTSATPKQANVGGVNFLRSRNGNLYRSGVVKASRASGKLKKVAEPCKRFTSTGVCRKRKCHLPHVDRAGQIRKHSANVADGSAGSTDNDDDLVSEDDRDEADTDDVDSDGLEEDQMQFLDDGMSQASHALSQQQDFVHL